jgi:hypothetical protein
MKNQFATGTIAQSARAGQLWPVNVTRLTELGVKHQHRPVDHVIVLACLCGGRLIFDDRKPYHHCFGDLSCRARSMRFEDVIAALAGEVREP